MGSRVCDMEGAWIDQLLYLPVSRHGTDAKGLQHGPSEARLPVSCGLATSLTRFPSLPISIHFLPVFVITPNFK